MASWRHTVIKHRIWSWNTGLFVLKPVLVSTLLPAFSSPSNSTISASHEETMLDDLGDKIACFHNLCHKDVHSTTWATDTSLGWPVRTVFKRCARE